MTSFDFRPRTRILFGAGEFARLGELAREQGGTRCLLIADAGMVELRRMILSVTPPATSIPLKVAE